MLVVAKPPTMKVYRMNPTTGKTICAGDVNDMKKNDMYAAPQDEEWIRMNASKVVAVDVDGTLTVPGKWIGEHTFYAIANGARDAMIRLKRDGYIIVIHTVRKRKDLVAEWLHANAIPFDYIESKTYARFYIDDRAITFQSWKETMEEVKRNED